MRDDDSDNEIIAVLRLRSQRAMQTIFAWLAILAITAGLAVHYYGAELGLVEGEPVAIANCFLCMAVCYSLTIFVWEWLFDPEK